MLSALQMYERGLALQFPARSAPALLEAETEMAVDAQAAVYTNDRETLSFYPFTGVAQPGDLLTLLRLIRRALTDEAVLAPSDAARRGELQVKYGAATVVLKDEPTANRILAKCGLV